jgi:hypothetical protein
MMFRGIMKNVCGVVCCAAVVMCASGDVGGMDNASDMLEQDVFFDSFEDFSLRSFKKPNMYSDFSRDSDLSKLKSLQEQTEIEKKELLGKLNSIYSVLATAFNSDATNTQIGFIEKSWNDFYWHVFQEKCLQEKTQGYYSNFEFCRHPKIGPFRTHCGRLLNIFKLDIEKNECENSALGDLLIAFLMVFDHTGLNKLSRTGFNWSEYELL